MSKTPKINGEYVKKVIDQLSKEVFSFDELRGEMPSDYDELKDALFSLLDESASNIIQVFNRELGVMQFTKRDQ